LLYNRAISNIFTGVWDSPPVNVYSYRDSQGYQVKRTIYNNGWFIDEKLDTSGFPLLMSAFSPDGKVRNLDSQGIAYNVYHSDAGKKIFTQLDVSIYPLNVNPAHVTFSRPDLPKDPTVSLIFSGVAQPNSGKVRVPDNFGRWIHAGLPATHHTPKDDAITFQFESGSVMVTPSGALTKANGELVLRWHDVKTAKSFAFDPLGSVVTPKVDATGKTTFFFTKNGVQSLSRQFDDLGRVTFQTDYGSNGLPIQSSKTEYDAMGQMKFSASYDGAGLLVSDVDYSYGEPGGFIKSTTYHPNGAPSKVLVTDKLGNTISDLSYDTKGLLTFDRSSLGYTFYAYDSSANLQLAHVNAHSPTGLRLSELIYPDNNNSLLSDNPRVKLIYGSGVTSQPAAIALPFDTGKDLQGRIIAQNEHIFFFEMGKLSVALNGSVTWTDKLSGRAIDVSPINPSNSSVPAEAGAFISSEIVASGVKVLYYQTGYLVIQPDGAMLWNTYPAPAPTPTPTPTPTPSPAPTPTPNPTPSPDPTPEPDPLPQGEVSPAKILRFTNAVLKAAQLSPELNEVTKDPMFVAELANLAKAYAQLNPVTTDETIDPQSFLYTLWKSSDDTAVTKTTDVFNKFFKGLTGDKQIKLLKFITNLLKVIDLTADLQEQKQYPDFIEKFVDFSISYAKLGLPKPWSASGEFFLETILQANSDEDLSRASIEFKNLTTEIKKTAEIKTPENSTEFLRFLIDGVKQKGKPIVSNDLLPTASPIDRAKYWFAGDPAAYTGLDPWIDRTTPEGQNGLPSFPIGVPVDPQYAEEHRRWALGNIASNISHIYEVANYYRITPDAIAGVILWEALENPFNSWRGRGWARFTRPGGSSTPNGILGKIHPYDDDIVAKFDNVVQERRAQELSSIYNGALSSLEGSTIFPIFVTESELRRIYAMLYYPTVAIEYIGAILDNAADEYEEEGFALALVDSTVGRPARTPYSIRNQGGILGVIYQGGDAAGRGQKFEERRTRNYNENLNNPDNIILIAAHEHALTQPGYPQEQADRSRQFIEQIKLRGYTHNANTGEPLTPQIPDPTEERMGWWISKYRWWINSFLQYHGRQAGLDYPKEFPHEPNVPSQYQQIFEDPSIYETPWEIFPF
jgi:hypothetical protein